MAGWTVVPNPDTSAWKPVAQSLPAGATGPLPGQPSLQIPAGLQGPATPPSISDRLTSAAATGADVGTGALKGAGSTANAIGSVVFPNRLATAVGMTPPTPQQQKSYFAPSNTAQSVGKGAEQIGEFMVPGLGEEAATADAGRLAPLAKIGYNALASGAINKAQGGNFTGGAIAGGVGSGIGQGLQRIAPAVAESALNIRKLDRAYKAPQAIGNAILDETAGFRPSSVAASAQSRLDELNPQLNAAADRASVTAAPRIAGALPAPAQEIRLGAVPQPPQMPGALFDAENFPPQNVGEARIIRNPKGQILPPAARNIEFPDESGLLPSGRNYNGQFLTRQPTREAFMSGPSGELPAVQPGVQGPGVWIRNPEIPTGEPSYPTTQPNRTASLASARGVLSNALNTAGTQGERTTADQLQPLAMHLGQTISGDPIPENITPRQLLDLKRGFGNEFVNRWNPDTMQGVKGTAAQAYHEMAQELNNTVPEAQGLNSRISNLIPIAKRADSIGLNAPSTQMMLHRLAVPTGAMVAPLGMGAYGYEKGGVGGAAKGFAEGMAIPLAAASPTGQMVLARGLNSPILRRLIVPGTVGAGLQLTRSNQNNPNQ